MSGNSVFPSSGSFPAQAAPTPAHCSCPDASVFLTLAPVARDAQGFLACSRGPRAAAVPSQRPW